MVINNGEILFRYAKPSILPEGQDELPLSIFNDPSMSCDWMRHREDPETSPHIDHGRNLIVSITVCDEIRTPRNPKGKGEIVDAWLQQIIHDPIGEEDGSPFTPNESHALIEGKKKAAVTTAIRKNSTYVIIQSDI